MALMIREIPPNVDNIGLTLCLGNLGLPELYLT